MRTTVHDRIQAPIKPKAIEAQFDPDMLTTAQVAWLLGTSQAYAISLFASGQIESSWVGPLRITSHEHVDAFLRRPVVYGPTRGPDGKALRPYKKRAKSRKKRAAC